MASQANNVVFRILAALMLIGMLVSVDGSTGLACQDPGTETATEKKAETPTQNEPDKEKQLSADQLESVVEAVQDSRAVFYDEIQPLQQKAARVTNPVIYELTAHRSLSRELSRIDDSSLKRVRTEIDQLNERLDVLLRIEEVLTSMDDDAAEKAVAEAKAKMLELEKKLQVAMQPVQEQQVAIHVAYADKHESFSKKFTPFFKESGSGKFEGYRRTHLGAAFTNGQINLNYEKGKEEKIPVSLNLQFVDIDRYENFAGEKEMLDQSLRIVSLSERNLVLYSDGVVIRMYCRKGQFTTDEMKEFFLDIVDRPKLEQLLNGLKESK